MFSKFVCREGYKLYIFLHKSSVTGRYQVSGMLSLATENREKVLSGFLEGGEWSPHYGIEKEKF